MSEPPPRSLSYAPKAAGRASFNAHPANDLLCGGIAGCVAKLTTAPLSRLTLLAQTSSLLASSSKAAASHGPAREFGAFAGSSVAQMVRTVIKTEGVQGLWKGTCCTLVHRFPFTGVNFMVNELMMQRTRHWQRGAAARLLPGAAAGCAAVFVCYPLEVARTLLLTESRNHGDYMSTRKLFLFAVNNWSLHNLRSLYRGIGVSLCITVPTVSASFGAFGWIKEQLVARTSLKEGSDTVTMLAGGLSGIVGSLVTFPADTVRRRIQVMGRLGETRRTCLEEVQAISKIEGVKGFFRGLTPEMLKVFPCVAITFWVYEVVKSRTA